MLVHPEMVMQDFIGALTSFKRVMLRSFALLGVLLAIVAFTGCSAGPWRGRLVEHGTDRAIEGAVVLAYWFGVSQGWREFRGAEEAVTDAGGSFVISARPADWGKPILVIFKPGFGEYRFQGSDAWPEDTSGWMEEARKAWDRFSSTGVVLELPRLATSEERRRRLVRVSWPHKVPPRATARMVAIIKQERTYLGLSD